MPNPHSRSMSTARGVFYGNKSYQPTHHTHSSAANTCVHTRARARDETPQVLWPQEGRFHGFATAIFSMDFRGIYIY